eukprot:4881523-Pyramimonas_sp.AAC.1
MTARGGRIDATAPGSRSARSCPSSWSNRPCWREPNLSGTRACPRGAQESRPSLRAPTAPHHRAS